MFNEPNLIDRKWDQGRPCPARESDRHASLNKRFTESSGNARFQDEAPLFNAARSVRAGCQFTVIGVNRLPALVMKCENAHRRYAA